VFRRRRAEQATLDVAARLKQSALLLAADDRVRRLPGLVAATFREGWNAVCIPIAVCFSSEAIPAPELRRTDAVSLKEALRVAGLHLPLYLVATHDGPREKLDRVLDGTGAEVERRLAGAYVAACQPSAEHAALLLDFAGAVAEERGPSSRHALLLYSMLSEVLFGEEGTDLALAMTLNRAVADAFGDFSMAWAQASRGSALR
jgi:hypothetical protein